jgi:FkbM family methyltransferase
MADKSDFAFLRSLADTDTDIEKINWIENARERIVKENAVISSRERFVVSLGGLRLTFRADLAPASVDTYLDIFRDNGHMRVNGFSDTPQEKLLIDLGANEGFYSIRMKLRNPELRIIAVEPLPANYQLLLENIRNNSFTGITAINQAITDINGTIELETYPHVGTMASRNINTMEQFWMKPDQVETIEVASQTLKRLFETCDIDTVDLLKMDVEGSELDILSGSLHILEKVRKIVIEWHSEELRQRCTQLLQDLGFTLVYQEEHRFGDLYFCKDTI